MSRVGKYEVPSQAYTSLACLSNLEVLQSFADRRADELADVLESARQPGKHRSMHSALTSQLGGHPFFSDTWHLSEQGMRAFCNTYLASLAEAWLLCEKPPIVWVHRFAIGIRRDRVRFDALRRGQGQGRKSQRSRFGDGSRMLALIFSMLANVATMAGGRSW